MPLRYLLDEHLRGPLWTAIQQHNAVGQYLLDAVRVGDSQAPPFGTLDPQLLLWAEQEERILVSFDKATLPDHLADHLRIGRHSPGVWLIRPSSTLRELLSFLVIAAYASDAADCQDRCEYIP